MKITKRQLRRIIKESLLLESLPSLEDAMFGAKETLEMAKDRRARAAADPDLADMFIEDAEDLEAIVDLFKREAERGAVPGEFSRELEAAIEALDTAVRDDVHDALYYAIMGEFG